MGKEDLCEQLKKKTNKMSTNYQNKANKLHSKMIKTKNCETIIVKNYVDSQFNTKHPISTLNTFRKPTNF